MNKRILLAVTMGLRLPWQEPVGTSDWLGLRPLIAELMSEAEVLGTKLDVFGYEYTDKRGMVELAVKIHEYERVILIGHSHGGHESWLVAEGEYGPTNKIMDLILLDPKPEGLSWFNFGFKYPIPPSVITPKSFYGGFGRPFELDALSTFLKIEHDEFCKSPVVHSYIREQVLALAKG